MMPIDPKTGKKVSLGVSRNNPGNLDYHPGINWKGLVLPHDGERFCKFDTPEHGIRALAKLLTTYKRSRGVKTLQEAMNLYAPPVENPTYNYVSFLAKRMGVGMAETIDLSNAGTLFKLVEAIIWFENGSQPYTLDQIMTGIRSALEVDKA